MVYKLGRFLQLLGLLIMPGALAGNMLRPKEIGEGAMLVGAGLGMGVFLLGWLLQRGQRPG